MTDYNFCILVTDYENSGENVLVFTRQLNAKQYKKALKVKRQQFEDCEEIPREDLQYYLFEPLYLSEQIENYILSYI